MLGAYDLSTYSRGRVICTGLRKQGVDVEVFLPRGVCRYVRTAHRLLQRNYNIILATGKGALLLSWLLRPIHGRRVIFDVFISDYENLVVDRRLLGERSLRARFRKWLDRFSCEVADFNILDTAEHIRYFCDEFGLAEEKFGRIWVGIDEDVFHPSSLEREEFLVSFHGTFIPLQGVDTIIRAAKILEPEGVRFRIIGTGQTYPAVRRLVDELAPRNVELLGRNVSLAELAAACHEASVCLGIFGNTAKAMRVIPNKVFESLAARRPLVTMDSPAIRELLRDGEDCLLCSPGDPQDLAEKITTLRDAPGLRAQLAEAGYRKVLNECSTAVIGERVKTLLQGFL